MSLSTSMPKILLSVVLRTISSACASERSPKAPIRTQWVQSVECSGSLAGAWDWLRAGVTPNSTRQTNTIRKSRFVRAGLNLRTWGAAVLRPYEEVADGSERGVVRWQTHFVR